MQQVELAEDSQIDVAVSANIIPKHLLNFKSGDKNLQQYYRFVVKDFYNHASGSEFTHNDFTADRCLSCLEKLKMANHPRLVSAHQKSRKLQKLLAESKTKKLSKYNSYLLKRFLSSSNYIAVRCAYCDQLKKQKLQSNEQKYKTKAQILQAAAGIALSDSSAESGKKKKKKKKRKEHKDDNHGIVVDPPQQTTESAIAVPNNLPSPTVSAPTTSKWKPQPHHQPPHNGKHGKLQPSKPEPSTSTSGKKKKTMDKGKLQSLLSGSEQKSSLMDFLSSL